MVKAHLPIVLLCFAGCMEPTPAGSPALGISEFRVNETAARLEITGVDAQGAVIGHLELTLGTFVREDDGRLVAGRKMTVKVGDKQVEHQSEGFETLALPLMQRDEDRPLKVFLSDAHVARPLERWGIGLSATVPDVAAAQPTEASYHSCTYGNNSSCGAIACCEYGSPAYQHVCCGNTSKYAERACTSPFSTSACGNTGPLGCAPCWSYDYYKNCSIDDYGSSCVVTIDKTSDVGEFFGTRFNGTVYRQHGSITSREQCDADCESYGSVTQACNYDAADQICQIMSSYEWPPVDDSSWTSGLCN